MTYFDSLEFVYQLIAARFDLVVWVSAVAVFAFALIVLFWLWGRIWNAEWSFFSSGSAFVLGFILALTAGASMLAWQGSTRSVLWLEQQQVVLERQLADSGSRNRKILVDTRQRLGGGSGGNENVLQINDVAELTVLAEVAAASVSCPLTRSGPLSTAILCRPRDPATVAREVVQNSPPPSYPISMSPDNPWVREAIASQVRAVLSHATPLLFSGMREIEKTSKILLTLSLVILMIFIPMFALGDIRVSPPTGRKGLS